MKVWFEKTSTYRTLMDEKELTFSKFLSPYNRMLLFGNMRPLDNKEIFVTNDYIFLYLHDESTTTLLEKIFYSLSSGSRL